MTLDLYSLEISNDTTTKHHHSIQYYLYFYSNFSLESLCHALEQEITSLGHCSSLRHAINA